MSRPPCPRCGTALNVRPQWRGSPLWRCGWCAFSIWATLIERQMARVVAEANEIARGAA
jgi:hypothetical protein